MARLNQIIAVEKSAKSRAFSEITHAHHALQKPALLSGIARTYQPKDDEGESLPSESTKVQVKAEDMLQETATILTRLFDVTATKDWANCDAKADVVIFGVTLLKSVPATYLLFLEKQLVDLHTFVKKLPTLDAAETWHLDAVADCWATDPVGTVRTKKVLRNHVKAEATDKHPAQVDVYTEDVQVGTWRTVKFSGALEAQRVNELLNRVEALQQAVKFAREEANNLEVQGQTPGKAFFDWLFA